MSDQEMLVHDQAPEPELTPTRWVSCLRESLANTQAEIHRLQNEAQNAEIKVHLALAEAGLDDESVAKARQKVLVEQGLAQAGAIERVKLEDLAIKARETADLLKGYAVAVFQETGEKDLGGVKVQDAKTPELLVPVETALEYGKKYIPNLITTITKWKNKRSFMSELRRRLTKQMDDEIAGIVELKSTPSAIVAADLSAYKTEAAPAGFIEENEIPF